MRIKIFIPALLALTLGACSSASFEKAAPRNLTRAEIDASAWKAFIKYCRTLGITQSEWAIRNEWRLANAEVQNREGYALFVNRNPRWPGDYDTVSWKAK